MCSRSSPKPKSSRFSVIGRAMTCERLMPLTGEYSKALERFHCLDEAARSLVWSSGWESK